MAPLELTSLREAEGKDLLEETAPARAAADAYLALIDHLGAKRIASMLSPRNEIEIKRIFEQSFVCIPGGYPVYLLSWQAIAIGCKTIEGDEEWIVGRDADSWEDRELMIRLQIMASRLSGEIGWDQLR